MKAIETRYKGYRFRSRLEARWAVLFDAMEWPWQYEPEGYVDDEGRCYLPDFKIGQRLFFEVKPAFPADKGIIPTLMQEREKWGGLLRADPEFELIVVFGPPKHHQDGIAAIRYYSDHSVERIRLIECRRCSGISWASFGILGVDDASEFPTGYSMRCKLGCNSERMPIVGEALKAAIDAALGARFEYGESGAPPKRRRR